VALSRRGAKLMRQAAASPVAAKRAGFPQKQAADLAEADAAVKRFNAGGRVRGVGCALRGYGKAHRKT
jgi:hypothetical protein